MSGPPTPGRLLKTDRIDSPLLTWEEFKDEMLRACAIKRELDAVKPRKHTEDGGLQQAPELGKTEPRTLKLRLITPKEAEEN